MSSLRKKILDALLDDLQVAKCLYDSPEACIQELEFDGDATVEFKLVLPSLEKTQLALSIPDNYPKEDLTLLTPGQGLNFSSDIKIIPATSLQDALRDIVDMYWKGKKPAGAEGAGKEKTAKGDKKDTKGKKKLKDSNYFEDTDEDGWVDDGEELVGSEWSASRGSGLEYVDEVEAAACAESIRKDVDAARLKFGKCGLHADEVTREFTVRLVLDTSFIDKWTAAAWGVNNTLPVIVEILFTWQYLNDRRMPPKVQAIYQSADKDFNARSIIDVRDFGLRWYLNNRLSDVFRRNWVKYYRNATDDEFRVIEVPAAKRKSSKKEKKDTVGKTSTTSHKSTPEKKDKKTEKKKGKSPKSKKTVTTSSKYAKQVNQLLEMGFGQSVAELALEQTSGDVEAASSVLADPDTLLDLEHQAQALAAHTDFNKEASLYTGFTGMSKDQVERLENFFVGEPFLVKVAKYLNMRMHCCSASCLICDAPLGFQGVKPAVCPKPLCTHSFEAYGLGFSLTSELRHNPEVVDLLVSITVGAAKNKRHNGADVFEPFPDSVQSSVKDKITGAEIETRSFRDGGVKNYALVAQICELLPSIEDMKQFKDEMLLKGFLDSMDTLCYPLLRWILMSNRAHLSLLPKDKQISEMGTPYQYVLVSDNPQKEVYFRKKRAENAKKKGGRGSFYAFHGSAIGNWHSIFRAGLRNYSNTDKMSCGAAYGPGIYMASNAATSFGYMAAGAGWDKTMMTKSGQSATIACIALCEVVDYRNDSSGLWGIGKPNPVNVHSGIYVITDETIVTTRYFFIYPQGSSSSSGAVADNLRLPEDIYK